MDSRKIDYEVMLGIKAHEKMPDELQERISNHLNTVCGPQARDAIKEIVNNYCKEQGWEITQRESSETSGIARVDDNGNISSEDNSVASFFKNIGKKKGIEDKRDFRSDFSDNHQGDIKSLAYGINTN